MNRHNKILFINGSPNKNGNTAALARHLLNGRVYDTLNLVDYKIYSYGQTFPEDQFNEVVAAMEESDILVIGSPLYWHNLSGSIRNMLDRFYGFVEEGAFAGKKLYFLLQGAAPQPWMMEVSEYTINRFASVYGLHYIGMATNAEEVRELASTLS